MKILHLPLTVPGSEQVGQEKGFRQVFGDVNYQKFDFLPLQGELGKNATNEALKATALEYQPDIIWAQLQETDVILPETWQQIKEQHPNIWLTCWSGDARDYVPAGMQQWLKYFDIFYNDTDQLELYKPYCNRYIVMPIAVDPEEGTDYSHLTPNIPDIVFIGNNYGTTFSNGPFRQELMAALTKEFGNHFGVFGTGWDQNEVNILGSCPVKHQGAYYHKAKIIISVDHIKGILHWSERLVWALMSGTPVIMENQQNFQGYDIEARVITFEQGNIKAAIDNIHKTLEVSEERRTKKAEEIKDWALTTQTWKQRAETVLSDYELYRKR